MHTNQIRFLAEINRTHSLHKASENLHITPQAISQSITALELELNTKLTDSSRKGTNLTKQGLVLLEAGEIFLMTIQEIQGLQPSNYRHLPHAKLSKSATDALSYTILPPAISKLYYDYPKAQVDMRSQATNDILQSLEDHSSGVDVSFISVYHYDDNTLPILECHPQLQFQPILKSSYYCSVSKQSPLAQYDTISLKSVLAHAILLYTSGKNIILDLLNHYGAPRKVVSIDNFSVFTQMLQQDTSYVTFARVYNSVTTMMPLVNRKLIPLKEDITVEFGYIYHRESRFSPETVEFLDFVEKFYRTDYGIL